MFALIFVVAIVSFIFLVVAMIADLVMFLLDKKNKK